MAKFMLDNITAPDEEKFSAAKKAFDLFAKHVIPQGDTYVSVKNTGSGIYVLVCPYFVPFVAYSNNGQSETPVTIAVAVKSATEFQITIQKVERFDFYLTFQK